MIKILIIYIISFSSLNAYSNYSVDQETITAEVNGISLAYKSVGRDEDPPVLMIMGLLASHKVWGEQIVNGLVDSGYRIILFDNRDTGDSEKLDRLGKPNLYWKYFLYSLGITFSTPYTLEDMAYDGVALLNHLEIDEAHIVGASMGGMIAQVMALEHPARIRSLTLFFSTPGFDTPGLSGPSENFKMAMKESFVLNLLGKEEEALIVTEKSLTGSRYPFDETNFAKEAKIRLKQGINTSNAQIAAVGASPNRASSLQEINRPTLIIHGSEDPLIPVDHGIYLQQNIPNAKKLILEGLGHEIPDQALSVIIPVMLNHFKL